jgi:hypothetical protein
VLREFIQKNRNIENRQPHFSLAVKFSLIYVGLAEKVHKTNLDATGREKW